MIGADRGRPQEIADGVFLVGGPETTRSEDCLCYLIAGEAGRVLIDCGAGVSAGKILDLAEAAGGGPPTDLLLTHAHIDHIGGAAEIKKRCGLNVLIHQGDAQVLRDGDAEKSAAGWYGLSLEPLEPDVVLTGGETIDLGGGRRLSIVHTPGHTPGSVAAWLAAGGRKILFGQDIHGPFSPAFGSDIDQWAESMRRLIELGADVLAEGHYGVYEPAEAVRAFIEDQLAAHGRL